MCAAERGWIGVQRLGIATRRPCVGNRNEPRLGHVVIKRSGSYVHRGKQQIDEAQGVGTRTGKAVAGKGEVPR